MDILRINVFVVIYHFTCQMFYTIITLYQNNIIKYNYQNIIKIYVLFLNKY